MANEKRMIDANALIEHLTRCKAEAKGLFGSVCVAIKCFVEQMPTVDAVEVVHGKWEILDDGYGCELMCCSVCKAEFYDGDNDTVDHPHNYCPGYGAKMDGDGNV